VDDRLPANPEQARHAVEEVLAGATLECAAHRVIAK